MSIDILANFSAHSGLVCAGVLCSAAHANSLKDHLDGARIFNAAVALELPAAQLVREVDSLTFCFTKGLGCPVGSVVTGSGHSSILPSMRRVIGDDGMRQAGVIAAAGLVALDTMTDRLARDHANARRLAAMLETLGFRL